MSGLNPEPKKPRNPKSRVCGASARRGSEDLCAARQKRPEESLVQVVQVTHVLVVFTVPIPQGIPTSPNARGLSRPRDTWSGLPGTRSRCPSTAHARRPAFVYSGRAELRASGGGAARPQRSARGPRPQGEAEAPRGVPKRRRNAELVGPRGGNSAASQSAAETPRLPHKRRARPLTRREPRLPRVA